MSDVTNSKVTNIAAFLPGMAERQPYTLAIVYPDGRDPKGKVRYTHYTFRQLNEESDIIARGLAACGIGQGVRTALMVRPSLEFFALTFAIFKAGAVPVMIDPGIGLKSLKACLAKAAPEAFIGIPAAHAARSVLGWGKETVKTLVTAPPPGGKARRLFWGGLTLDDVKDAGRSAEGEKYPALAPTQADDVAAVLFTSGSTGPPKGAVYRHGHFVAQVDAIRDAYGIEPGEVDLPTFPLFALFDPALGMTTIVPDMDPTKPAAVDPRKVFEAIDDFGVTNMFGSPALLNTVGRYGAEHGVKLPTLKRVISAGAPVPAVVMERFLTMLDDGARIHTPYGATESLPVASIHSGEVLSETSALTDEGRGVCVGRPVGEIDVRVIQIRDDVIDTWDDALELPAGEIGEIVVSGPVATDQYIHEERLTALAKIYDRDESGDVVSHRHRMGDVGYFDNDGRLWFCGRKAHRVETANGTLYSVPCEAVFNVHPSVFRTALVGVGAAGSKRPVLCVELEKGAGVDQNRVVAELRELGRKYDHTRSIEDFLFHSSFPVDIRHNAKIGREKLTVWATGKLS